MTKLFKIIFLFTLSITLSNVSYASNSLENQLLSTLNLKIDNEGNIERKGNYGRAIQGYMKQGYISKKPDLYRADYVDYYVLNRPAYILGQELKVIEEEYMSEYIGCCVSEGVGVVLKVSGNTRKLNNFARKNRCNIQPINYTDYLKDNSLTDSNRKGGRFVNMSCRARDIARF